MKRHCEESSRRWNFDFEGERPLAGRFAWKMAPAAAIGAAAATVFVPPSLVPARLSSPPAGGQPQQAALDNRENMAEVGGRRGAAGVRSSAATPPVGLSAFIAGSVGGVDLLAGSPAGSLDDLRTPAPPSPTPRGTELTAAQVASGKELTAAQLARGTEPVAAQAANRLLSDSTTRAAEELGGARPKTKEQKITGRKISFFLTVLLTKTG
jgi:hypothetical protein